MGKTKLHKEDEFTKRALEAYDFVMRDLAHDIGWKPRRKKIALQVLASRANELTNVWLKEPDNETIFDLEEAK